MFTTEELGVLRNACAEYKGVYAHLDPDTLHDEDLIRHKRSIVVAKKLCGRIEEILLAEHQERMNIIENASNEAVRKIKLASYRKNY